MTSRNQLALNRLAQANSHRQKLWKCPDCHVRCRIENAPNHADACEYLQLAALETLNRPARGAADAATQSASESTGTTAQPFDDWHDDDHDVLWWHFPIREPPYVGSPLASDWPFGVGDEPSLGWTRIVVPTQRLREKLFRLGSQGDLE